jgi:iron complex outermembrane receptor protein
LAASTAPRRRSTSADFGAFATSNSPGAHQRPQAQRHRHGAVDLSTIPRDSIERIEITRGNSGAVLYGDNASRRRHQYRPEERRRRPAGCHAREAGVGSFNQRYAQCLGRDQFGPWSTSFYGNGIKSDGYAKTNALDQRNGVGNINYTTPDLKAF